MRGSGQVLFFLLCCFLFGVCDEEDAIEVQKENLFEDFYFQTSLNWKLNLTGLKNIYVPHLAGRIYASMSNSNELNGSKNPSDYCWASGTENRRCTREEKKDRRDLIAVYLEDFISFSRRPITTQGVDLIWLKISLPVVRTHDFPLVKFKQLSPKQRINRFPLLATEINQKDNFAENIREMQNRFGEEHFNFHPKTFLLPRDFNDLSSLAAQNLTKKWIAKPVFGGQGRGIHLVHGDQILNGSISIEGDYLVQHYIENPLLINGFKHTLRIYVLITSISPLRIYIYSDGIAKFATKPFSNTLNMFLDEHINMHVTNQALNSMMEGFNTTSSEGEMSQGSRWNLKSWRKYIQQEFNINDTAIWEDIKSIIGRGIIAAHEKLLNSFNEIGLEPSCCFQLLGTDVDIDSNFKPWLIESNVNPTMTAKLPYERKSKLAMVEDMFNMLKISKHDVGQISNTIRERIKHIVDTKPGQLMNITSADMNILVDLEYETLMKGGWERIYPHKDTVDYLSQFFTQKSQSTKQFVSEWVKFIEYEDSLDNF